MSTSQSQKQLRVVPCAVGVLLKLLAYVAQKSIHSYCTHSRVDVQHHQARQLCLYQTDVVLVQLDMSHAIVYIRKDYDMFVCVATVC